MQIVRKARIVGHFVKGVLLVATRYRRADAVRREQMVQSWSVQLLRLCGITLKVHTHGEVLDAGTMVVSNHVSWLDIYVIDAWRPTPFVAKSEIATWPVIGWLASAIGTVFIQRERRGDTKRIVERLSCILQTGGLICVFPEGTTTDGSTVLPFHANVLQAAVSAQANVQPICLMYEDADGRQTVAPAYIGDVRLGESLRRVLSRGPMVAHLHVGPALRCPSDRRSAASISHAAVADALRALQATVAEIDDADARWAAERLEAVPMPVARASAGKPMQSR